MKPGDWVRVLKSGLSNKPFQIESVDGNTYTVFQKEGTYVYRTKIRKEEINHPIKKIES